MSISPHQGNCPGASQVLQPEFTDSIGIVDLAQACGMNRQELEELIEYRALLPLTLPPSEPVFAIEWVQPLRTASKLRRDYDLDLFVVVIVVDYLRRIDELELKLQSLQARSGA